MTDLIERYVHQVGRYLPPKERADIEAELRSQIHDQLEDRFAESPSEADVAAVLAELGHPYLMAASYSSEQYLVGPLLYPYMMMVLRYGWLIVPTIVIFLNVFGALASSQPTPLLDLLVGTVIGAGHATLLFSAVVVLIFAIIQRANIETDESTPFKPLDLPKVDDPRTVDRFESTFGVAFGTIMVLVFLYFLRVGGLTLRFDLSDPGEVIPVSPFWLLLLIIVTAAILIVHVLVLRRNRWTVGLWLTGTVLETVGLFAMYFVVYRPVFEHLIRPIPALANVPFIDSAPEIFAAGYAVLMLAGRGRKLVKLLNYKPSSKPPYIVQTDG